MHPNTPETDRHLSVPGPVALVGSGEYTPAMVDTDRELLSLIGGAADARVALLPTASGLEPGRPAYWNNLGLDHFRNLGVLDRARWTSSMPTTCTTPPRLSLCATPPSSTSPAATPPTSSRPSAARPPGT